MSGLFSTNVQLENCTYINHKSVIEARFPRFLQYIVSSLPFLSVYDVSVHLVCRGALAWWLFCKTWLTSRLERFCKCSTKSASYFNANIVVTVPITISPQITNKTVFKSLISLSCLSSLCIRMFWFSLCLFSIDCFASFKAELTA